MRTIRKILPVKLLRNGASILEVFGVTEVLTIGEMARRTGTKVNTIRFYEDIGLLPVAVRTQSGRRTYGSGDVRRLAFVRHARDLGFPVAQVRSLLQLVDRPDQDCSRAGAIARAHVTGIEKRIERLELLRDALKEVATACSSGSSAHCRVLELIADWETC